MQVTIAKQLGLEPTTVGNFFMNARRRSMDKWKDEDGGAKSPGASSMGDGDGCDVDGTGSVSMCGSPSPPSSPHHHGGGGHDGGGGGGGHVISHGSLHHSLATDAL